MTEDQMVGNIPIITQDQNPVAEGDITRELPATNQGPTNQQANTSRYPRRERTKPKYLEQFVDGIEQTI